jgi:hypothetical protein
VFTLETYGVKEILGIQYGFKGFADKKYPPIMVMNIAWIFSSQMLQKDSSNLTVK